MDIVHCSFCKHGNPADAKFCNACGSSLALQLCEACGAIDNVSATVCHKCGHPFAPRSDVAAADTDAAQSLTPAAQAEESAAARRSPWKLFALLAVIVAGTLVIYPRVAGDEARLPAIHAPTEAGAEAEAKADSPPPDSPPGDAAEAAPSEAASETADAAQPPTDAAPSPATAEPAEDTPAPPIEPGDEALVAPPSPTEATTESAQEAPSAPTIVASPPQAPAADNAQTSAVKPQTTPAGCSPAIDALGLCNRGFR